MINFTYPIVFVAMPFIFGLYFFIKQSTKNEKLFSKDILEKIVKNSSFFSKKTKDIFLILSLVLALVAISRPYIKGQLIEVKSSSYSLIVGFDISRSMKCDDLYPSRLDFAKNRFNIVLNNIKDAKIGVIGFSSQAFLISPISSDYDSLRFLVKNLDTSYISLRGTSILSALSSANELYEKNSKNKAILLFSDGGDATNYDKEIEYAKEHNIKVFIYATATTKGGVLRDKDGIVKDKKGNIVVLKRNENIKKLALQSKGAYLVSSYDKDDIHALLNSIKDSFSDNLTTSNKKVINSKELFYYPLIFSILLVFLALFSLQRRER